MASSYYLSQLSSTRTPGMPLIAYQGVIRWLFTVNKILKTNNPFPIVNWWMAGRPVCQRWQSPGYNRVIKATCGTYLSWLSLGIEHHEKDNILNYGIFWFLYRWRDCESVMPVLYWINLTHTAASNIRYAPGFMHMVCDPSVTNKTPTTGIYIFI